MTDKVFVSKIAIKNAFGISDVEIAPGKVTVIEGKNGRGKTSLINALQSVFLGGNNKALLKNDAEKGEVVVSFTDDVVVSRRFTKKTNKLEITKNGEIVPEPQTFLNEEYLSSLGSNPMKLLQAGKTERTKLFLDTLPLDVDLGHLNEVVGIEVDAVPGEHGIVLLDRVRKSLYVERTSANRMVSEKEKMIAAMKKSTLPNAEASAKVLQDEINKLQNRRDNILGSESEEILKAEQSLASELNLIRQNEKALREKIDNSNQALAEKVAVVKSKLDAEIKLLTDAAENEIAGLKDESKSAVEQEQVELSRIPDLINCKNAEGQSKISEVKSTFSSSKLELSTQIQLKQESLDNAKYHINRNKEIITFEKELDDHKREANALNDSIAALDKFKLGLLKNIDLKGFDYEDGKIFIDGVPFEAVNTARLMDVAVDLARLQSPRLGLMCIDGVESLDASNFKLFMEKASESDMHLIVTRVTDDEEMRITEAA